LAATVGWKKVSWSIPSLVCLLDLKEEEETTHCMRMISIQTSPLNTTTHAQTTRDKVTAALKEEPLMGVFLRGSKKMTI